MSISPPYKSDMFKQIDFVDIFMIFVALILNITSKLCIIIFFYVSTDHIYCFKVSYTWVFFSSVE